MQKCFGVTIKDKVQDIGFRRCIENIARSNYLEDADKQTVII